MEIVIGFQGKEHVTPGQLGRIIGGIAGTGEYVLETQNEFAATMQSANQIQISTGDLVMQGRGATVEAPETLTIESGVSGQNRNDLVVARYEKDASSSVEKCELKVIKGTAVSGTATDPSCTKGDIIGGDLVNEMPLWRVPIEGITPGTPIKLFETIPSIDGLRDFVSHIGKTLWSSSGLYMREGQTATLSEPVSAQVTGILLVWRQYNGGAMTASAGYQFVPKAAVAAYPGMGTGTLLTTASGAVIGTKYVYVSDNEVVGHAANYRDKTLVESTGIYVTPKSWVLTDIYGC